MLQDSKKSGSPIDSHFNAQMRPITVSAPDISPMLNMFIYSGGTYVRILPVCILWRYLTRCG
jgi:hypothetical protein